MQEKPRQLSTTESQERQQWISSSTVKSTPETIISSSYPLTGHCLSIKGKLPKTAAWCFQDTTTSMLKSQTKYLLKMSLWKESQTIAQ